MQCYLHCGKFFKRWLKLKNKSLMTHSLFVFFIHISCIFILCIFLHLKLVFRIIITAITTFFTTVLTISETFQPSLLFCNENKFDSYLSPSSFLFIYLLIRAWLAIHISFESSHLSHFIATIHYLILSNDKNVQ